MRSGTYGGESPKWICGIQVDSQSSLWREAQNRAIAIFRDMQNTGVVRIVKSSAHGLEGVVDQDQPEIQFHYAAAGVDAYMSRRLGSYQEDIDANIHQYVTSGTPLALNDALRQLAILHYLPPAMEVTVNAHHPICTDERTTRWRQEMQQATEERRKLVEKAVDQLLAKILQDSPRCRDCLTRGTYRYS